MREYQILVTGGGTSGHVHPVDAVLQALRENGANPHDIAWLGCAGKPEETSAQKHEVDFFPITSGKLRRYFSMENIVDIFRVIRGIFQCLKLIKKLEPKVLFTSGGYVAVPGILAAAWLKVPIIAYEADRVPGISNKIAFKYASTICLGYKSTCGETKYDKKEVVHTGTPIRKSLLEESMQLKPEFLKGVTEPILFFLGGSQGAHFINTFVEKNIDSLTKDFFVVHQHGPNNKPVSTNKNYQGFGFMKEELPYLYEHAEMVVSRAGSVITEIAAFKKPCILIPIPKSANNHQYYNARTLEKAQAAMLVQQSSGYEFLLKKIQELHKNESLRKVLSENITPFYEPDAAKKIAAKIEQNL